MAGAKNIHVEQSIVPRMDLEKIANDVGVIKKNVKNINNVSHNETPKV